MAALAVAGNIHAQQFSDGGERDEREDASADRAESGAPEERTHKTHVIGVEVGHAALVGFDGLWFGANYAKDWNLSDDLSFRVQPTLLFASVEGPARTGVYRSQLAAALVRGMVGYAIWGDSTVRVGLFTGIARGRTDSPDCGHPATFVGVPGGLSLDWSVVLASTVELGAHVDWGELPVPKCTWSPGQGPGTTSDARRPYLQASDTSGLFGVRLGWGWQ